MHNDSDDPDPEELLQQSKTQRRTSTEPTSSDAAEARPDLVDAIAAAFDDLEAGELNSTFGFRDARLVALFVGLERSGELVRVVTDAQRRLGREPDPDAASRSQLASLLIRLGIRELDADLLDAASDAHSQHTDVDPSEY